jgi:hypothetical protein
VNTHRHAFATVADLLGLPRFTIKAVERRADGAYAVVLNGRRLAAPANLGRVPRWATSKRVLRIPARRVEGYRQRSPHVRARDLRARRKKNARAFAWWLHDRLGHDVPVVERALRRGDLAAVDELRAALIAATPLGHNGDGERAA